MEFSEQVVILQLGKFKESDLWVRFLSPSRGVMSAFAFGGSRSKRRFVGCLDVFNVVLFRIEHSVRTNFFWLQEGVLLKGPDRLRRDWGRLGMATNCSMFMQAFGLAPEGSEKAHRLFIELLQLLEEADTLPGLLPFYFRMRLAAEQGYEIDLRQCASCGAPLTGDTVFFHVRAGHMLCRDCLATCPERTLAMHPEALSALHTAVSAPLNRWNETPLSPRDRYACSRAIDGFIHYHVGITWENGRFTRS